ncbi:MAG: DUF6814 family protein [Saprospiraceae bacterium]
MNNIKKIAGYFWMISAIAIVVFMVWQASEKISGTIEGISRTNAFLQWTIILIIFIPICCGFFIFGYYASQGEYDHLPQSSEDLS